MQKISSVVTSLSTVRITAHSIEHRLSTLKRGYPEETLRGVHRLPSTENADFAQAVQGWQRKYRRVDALPHPGVRDPVAHLKATELAHLSIVSPPPPHSFLILTSMYPWAGEGVNLLTVTL